jgi:hypothetical protein
MSKLADLCWALNRCQVAEAFRDFVDGTNTFATRVIAKVSVPSVHQTSVHQTSVHQTSVHQTSVHQTSTKLHPGSCPETLLPKLSYLPLISPRCPLISHTFPLISPNRSARGTSLTEFRGQSFLRVSWTESAE